MGEDDLDIGHSANDRLQVAIEDGNDRAYFGIIVIA